MQRLRQAGIAALAGLLLSRALSASPVCLLCDLQRADARVATIGWTLATTNRALCDLSQRVTGLRLHALPLYAPAFRPEARQHFGIDDRPAVLVVVPGSAADRADLVAGDRIMAIDGAETALVPEGKAGADVLAALELELAAIASPLPVTIARAGKTMTVRYMAEPGCATRFELNPSSRLNASADGVAVRITTAVQNETRDDAELAFVLAHEMAHNVLDHPAKLKAAGRTTGRIRATEIEADRLAVQMMHMAGYDPAAAARFWERFGKKTGYGIFSDGTHLRTKARVALLQAEARQIAQ
jgi:beta-barrel assembly-enhancing protease